MKSKVLVILIVAVSLAAGLSSYLGREKLAKALNEKAASEQEKQAFESLSIHASPVLLNNEDITQSTVGELAYVAGWSLTSDNENFGGWSGFLLENGRDVLAINDQGNWLKADLDISAAQPISGAQIALFDQSGNEADKADYDAESIVAVSDGYLVGFEVNHRIMHVDVPAEGNATPYETGVDFSGLSYNSGVEAMTLVSGNRLLLFAENGRDTEGRTQAWESVSGNSKLLDFRPPQNYAPTEAATLPNGDVLMLLRHYSVMAGASAKLLHIPAAELEADIIRGREIATIAKPLSVDNMEGLDVEQNEDGSYRLYIISDDNFSSRQQTLLMVFDWSPETVTAQAQ